MKIFFLIQTFFYFFLVLLFFLVAFLFLFPPVIGDLSGDTGIRIMSEKCFGFRIREKDLLKTFPPGAWEKTILKTHFVYSVPAPVLITSDKNPIYCIGIDI
jgi:hypothetical protein